MLMTLIRPYHIPIKIEFVLNFILKTSHQYIFTICIGQENFSLFYSLLIHLVKLSEKFISEKAYVVISENITIIIKFK